MKLISVKYKYKYENDLCSLHLGSQNTNNGRNGIASAINLFLNLICSKIYPFFALFLLNSYPCTFLLTRAVCFAIYQNAEAIKYIKKHFNLNKMRTYLTLV